MSATPSASGSAAARSRNPLPEGTLAVGAGLLLSGVAIYGFLAMASRGLGPDRYEPLAVMWTMTFLVAPGFFLPVEQEVGRALAHRRTLGLGGGPVVRRAATLGAGLLAMLLVTTLATSPLLVHKLFGGQWLLLVGFLLALVGYYAGHLSRGALSGNGRFRNYAVFMGVDGLFRLLAGGLLVAVGIDAVGPFALVVGLAPMVALACALRGQRDLLEPGPEAPWSELTANLGWLLAGSVFAAGLVNAGPIAVKVLAANDAERQLAGHFLNGLIISRVPLFLFQAVQASLLPKLARLAAAQQYDEFRAGFRKLVTAVAAIGITAVVGSFAIGPFTVRTLFGPEYELERRTLAMLALASAVYMGALALAQALIALHAHAKVAAGWCIGVAAFLVVVALGHDLLLRVELGLVGGSAAALCSFGLALAPRLRSGEQPDTDSLMEALHDLPIEP